MIAHPFPYVCVSAVLLFVSCDKQQGVGRPGKDAEPVKSKVTRSARPPGEEPAVVAADPRVALKSALEIQAATLRDNALAEVAWNSLELDPEVAREAFDALSAESAEKTRLLQHFAMRHAELNPEEALAWAESLGSEKEISDAKGRIALVLAESDPERAAGILSESGVAGREFDVSAVQVLQRWAAKSPPEAAAWVVMFPAGQSREAGIKTVVSAWAKSDTRAAFTWLAALQDETIRDESTLAMAEILLQQPEEVGTSWLQHADSKTRTEIERQREKLREKAGDDAPSVAK